MNIGVIIIVILIAAAGIGMGWTVTSEDERHMTREQIEKEEYWRHGRHGA